MYDIPFKINWPYTYIDTYLYTCIWNFGVGGRGILLKEQIRVTVLRRMEQRTDRISQTHRCSLSPSKHGVGDGGGSCGRQLIPFHGLHAQVLIP